LYALLAVVAVCVFGASRQDKLKSLSGRNVATEYSTYPPFTGRDITNPSNLFKLAFENMAATFDSLDDVLPDGRPKLIHVLGSTAEAEFIASKDSPYTGLFQGADSCLIRVSLAGDPHDNNFIPGMAMKCLRDGVSPSGNVLAMRGLDGQGADFNAFSNSWFNAVNPPSNKALRAVADIVFKRASQCPSWISNAQWARADQEGKPVLAPRWPIEAEFRPTDEIKASGKNIVAGSDLRDQLKSIPPQTQLFNVYTKTAESDSVKIGEIWTKSRFIASDFQDNILFFRHERGEVDGCNSQWVE